MMQNPATNCLNQFNTVFAAKWDRCRFVDCGMKMDANLWRLSSVKMKTTTATRASNGGNDKQKVVWIWTENKQVMTTAVERGWSTFLFPANRSSLADEWSTIALISPLFAAENGDVCDSDRKRIAVSYDITSPEQLEKIQPAGDLADTLIVDLLDWQVIPAENIVAAFQGSERTVLAVSRTPSEARAFLEALEHGLGGVVLKVEDPEAILELKDYFDRRNEAASKLNLSKATVTNVQMTGMGDRVCVDICSLMRPGEGLLVGSFARGLFLVHSECQESSYISSRPFRVNAGPVHAYVAIPGGKTSYLSELKTGKEVIVVDPQGFQRTTIVGRVKVETRQLILVEAKIDSVNQTYSILLQNAETVSLVSSAEGEGSHYSTVPVTSLKVGDEVLVRVQGGARHTGIEIQEFIVEK